MNEASGPFLAEALEARMALRLAVRFTLDVTASDRVGMAVLDALLFGAIVSVNIGGVIQDPVQQAAYARLDRSPPDDLRRPISINGLAESLRQPYETVRRRVRKLAAAGLCAMSARGVYVPDQVVRSPHFEAVQKFHYARAVRYLAALQAVGAVADLPFAPPPVDDPRAPVRAVGRLVSDYLFRTFDLLQRQARDPLSGLILLQVLQLSADHIAAPQLQALLAQGPLAEAAQTPVRPAQVARRLGMPYETTRRRMGWLVEDGVCRRARGGVLVADAAQARPAMAALVHENLINVRRLQRGFAALDGAF